MRYIILTILIFLSLPLLATEKYHECRALQGNDAHKCFLDLIKDESAPVAHRIYSGIYITKNCKDGGLKICTYDDIDTSILLAEQSEFKYLVYDLKYYKAVSLFKQGEINKNNEKVLESIRLLEEILDNMNKLQIIYPSLVFIQMWNGYRLLNECDKALESMEAAYKTVPGWSPSMKKRVGKDYFDYKKERADRLIKEGVCSDTKECNLEKCRTAIYYYLDLKDYNKFNVSQDYYMINEPNMRESLRQGRACFKAKSDIPKEK